MYVRQKSAEVSFKLPSFPVKAVHTCALAITCNFNLLIRY